MFGRSPVVDLGFALYLLSPLIVALVFAAIGAACDVLSKR